jgi:indole-3-glycerol phosphate synthase
MTSADLLETIVAATRQSVGTRERSQPLSAIDRRVARQPRGAAFRDALSLSPSPRVIAECKRRSPSRGMLRRAYDPAAHAAAFERAGAAAVSVLTEPTFFDGSLQHLVDVRAAVSVPLLRKDFIVTEYQIAEAAAAGADAVLLIVGALDDRDLRALLSASDERGLAALVEVHDAAELERAARAGAGIVGVNSRDLRTLRVQPGILDALATRIPPGVIAVAESGIRSGTDLVRLESAGYHAFLVGERLITQDDPGAALKELRSR